MLCINKLLREGLLGSSMEEQLKYITEGASTADGMTRKHAKLCFLLCFMVAQTKTPNRSHIKRKSCRDGVVYGRDNLDKFVKGTLLLCRKFPVEKTVDSDELQTQLRVLGKEVSIPVAEVLQCLVKWENRCVKSAGQQIHPSAGMASRKSAILSVPSVVVMLVFFSGDKSTLLQLMTSLCKQQRGKERERPM